MAKILHNNVYYRENEMKDIVKEYYSAVFSRKGDRHFEMQKLFPADLNKKSNILDYGCGMGGISQLFNEKYD